MKCKAQNEIFRSCMKREKLVCPHKNWIPESKTLSCLCWNSTWSDIELIQPRRDMSHKKCVWFPRPTAGTQVSPPDLSCRNVASPTTMNCPATFLITRKLPRLPLIHECKRMVNRWAAMSARISTDTWLNQVEHEEKGTKSGSGDVLGWIREAPGNEAELLLSNMDKGHFWTMSFGQSLYIHVRKKT